MEIGKDDYLIGIGSNLDYPVHQVLRAVSCISLFETVTEFTLSSLYRSSAWGGITQPDYINAVMAVRGVDEPELLLENLQAVEAAAGRERTGEQWAARVLDLDLLVAGREIIDSAELTVPHPRLAERLFVLLPMQEIAPKLTIPGLPQISDMIRECSDSGQIQQLDDNEISYLRTFNVLER